MAVEFGMPLYVSADIEESENESDWQQRSERWKIADDPYRYYRW